MRLSYEHYSLSSYEQSKRAATLAFLGRERYARAFEPGCGYGHLSKPLSERCDSLLAWECDKATHDKATDFLAPHENIDVELAHVPAMWPTGNFDLIVLCEILYYLTPEDLREVAGLADASLCDGGELIACHWRHPIPESELVGDYVHRVIGERTDLTMVREQLENDYVLTLWRRDLTEQTI